MTKTGLTTEEKRCLQMWFRQALAQVEAEEAAHRLLKEHSDGNNFPAGHRQPMGRRRTYRNRRSVQLAQLVH